MFSDQEDAASSAQTREKELSPQVLAKANTSAKTKSKHTDSPIPVSAKSQATESSEFDTPVQVKEEPLDDYELPSVMAQNSSAGPMVDHIHGEGYGTPALNRSLRKREVQKNSPKIFRESTPTSGSQQDANRHNYVPGRTRQYAGKWAQNTMNLNEDYVSHKAVSSNLYTVLPYKPTQTDLFKQSKRGRPRKYRPAQLVSCYDKDPSDRVMVGAYDEDYLADNISVGIEVDEVQPEFDYEANAEVANFEPLAKETESPEVTKTSGKGKSKTTGKKGTKEKLKVKMGVSKEKVSKGKKNDISSKKSKMEASNTTETDFDNTAESYVEVKQEVVDEEYASNEKEPEYEQPMEETGPSPKRKSKRKRSIRQTKQLDFDYNEYTDSDEIATSSKKANYIPSQMDNDYSVDNIVKYPSWRKKGSASTTTAEPIISPSLLKGSRYVGTICQTSVPDKREQRERQRERQKANAELKEYLTSIGIDYNNPDSDLDSDPESDSEPIEVPAGVKVVPPVAIVPEGTRSRYTQPTIVDVKDKFVRTQKGKLKKVARVMQYKPKIFQGHQKKPNDGPVYVMCHPTKPIVRL